MRPSDLTFSIATLASGAWAGSALAGAPGAVAGGLLGASFGVLTGVAGVRLAVAIPVFVGTLAGGILGRSVVHALCLPSACEGTEVTAAILTGFGSLIGVGLVVALVTRSFDEYRESKGDDNGHRTSGNGPG